MYTCRYFTSNDRKGLIKAFSFFLEENFIFDEQIKSNPARTAHSLHCGQQGETVRSSEVRKHKQKEVGDVLYRCGNWNRIVRKQNSTIGAGEYICLGSLM